MQENEPNQEKLIKTLEELGFDIKSKDAITGQVTVRKNSCCTSGEVISTEKGKVTPSELGYVFKTRRWDILFSPVAGKNPNRNKTDLESLPDALKTKLYGFALCMQLLENIKLYETEIRLNSQIVDILKEKADEQAVKGKVSGELYCQIRDFEKKIASLEFGRNTDQRQLEKNIPFLNGKNDTCGIAIQPFESPLIGNKEKLLLNILNGKEIIRQDIL